MEVNEAQANIHGCVHINSRGRFAKGVLAAEARGRGVAFAVVAFPVVASTLQLASPSKQKVLAEHSRRIVSGTVV